MTYITLISNDPSGGGRNTLSSFKNVFDPPIPLKSRLAYSIALQSIGFDYNALAKISQKPDLIRVKLKQLHAQIEGEKSCDTILHQFSLENNLSSNENFVYHNPEVKTFISLKHTPCLSELSIVLQDENDQQLNLGEGQPTFVVMEVVSSKDQMGRDVIWHISSLDRKCVYKDKNMANYFKISFPHDIARDIDHNRWEVALTNCVLPAQLKIDGSVKIDDVWLQTATIHRTATHIGDYKLGSAENRDPIPTSTTAILEKLCEEVNRENEEKGNTMVRMSVETDNEGKKLILETQTASAVLMSSKLSLFLFNEDKPQSFQFKHKMEKRIVDYNFDLLRPHSVVIYCSAIAPQIYGGNQTKKVLAHLPILRGKGDRAHYEYQPKHLNFFPLSTLLTDTIHFELHSVSGKMIEFENKSLGTYLTLVLRKKSKKRKK